MERGILWIVLDESERRHLLEYVKPIFPVLFAHHITLFYDVELSAEQKSLLGSKQLIRLGRNSYNRRIQAVTVELPVASQNVNPHITISAIEGVKPVESNVMLESEHMTLPVSAEYTLNGSVEFMRF